MWFREILLVFSNVFKTHGFNFVLWIIESPFKCIGYLKIVCVKFKIKWIHAEIRLYLEKKK